MAADGEIRDSIGGEERRYSSSPREREGFARLQHPVILVDCCIIQGLDESNLRFRTRHFAILACCDIIATSRVFHVPRQDFSQVASGSNPPPH